MLFTLQLIEDFHAVYAARQFTKFFRNLTTVLSSKAVFMQTNICSYDQLALAWISFQIISFMWADKIS